MQINESTFIWIFGIILFLLVLISLFNKTNHKKISDTSDVVLNIVLIGLLVPTWVIIQKGGILLIELFKLDELGENFVSGFRLLLGTVTFILIGIEVGKRILITWKKAKKEVTDTNT